MVMLESSRLLAVHQEDDPGPHTALSQYNVEPQTSLYTRVPPRHRQSSVNPGEIERVRRFRTRQIMGESRRSSIATVSTTESRALLQRQFRTLHERVPTTADLESINKTLSTSVATFAEYNRFHGVEDSRTSLAKSERKLSKANENETGIQTKRPDDCVVVTSDPKSMERVTINVSGRIFETYRFMFKRFSDGLLGDDAQLQSYWDEGKKQYYFDHSSECFEGILQYYQTGFLRVPHQTHLRSFLESLEFFQFSKHTINKLKTREAVLIDDKTRLLPTNPLQRDVWLLLEEPHSSRSAHITAIFSVAMIILSITCFCWETLPEHTGHDCVHRNTILEGRVVSVQVPVFDSEFFLVETVCVFWFTVEFLLRFLCCPSSKLQFFKSPMNLSDLISVLPYYVMLSYALATSQCPSSKAGPFLMLRALRILRVFKLTRFSQGLRILTASLRASRNELMLVFVFVVMASFVFAVILYGIESDYPGTQMTSLLEGYWFGVATITTVGYGDVVPQSPIGKLVSVVCIILGTLGLALPAPVIVANFNRYYRNETGRGFDDSDWIKR